MAARVSIVMPCFNAARWLPRTLATLARQDYPDFEIVAVDDGSTDATGAVLEAHAASDPRIRVIRIARNVGIVGALNRGLDEARGEFIARIDADDEALPQRLSVQVQFLQRHDLGLCGSWFVEFGQGISRAVNWPHEEAAVRAVLLFQNPICHPTVLARRRLFERFRYREDQRLAEDYDLFSRASAEFRLALVPQVLLRYRRHSGQATQAQREAMEAVTRRIRLANLERQGIPASPEEQRLHNLVRAPASIDRLDDLDGIERWLGKVLAAQAAPEARRAVASQWQRACIRAAPLGTAMWRAWRRSPLRAAAGAGLRADADLFVLSRLRLDYAARPFEWLRRFGLSA